MKSFKQYLKEDDIDRIIIELPDNLMISIEESRWVSSGKQGWEVRVDPENPALKVKRHATVARSKHKRSKNMQASWKTDGTRHDKNSFNSKVGSLSIAKDIARKALDLDNDVTLESMTKAGELLQKMDELLLEGNDSKNKLEPQKEVFLKAILK